MDRKTYVTKDDIPKVLLDAICAIHGGVISKVIGAMAFSLPKEYIQVFLDADANPPTKAMLFAAIAQMADQARELKVPQMAAEQNRHAQYRMIWAKRFEGLEKKEEKSVMYEMTRETRDVREVSPDFLTQITAENEKTRPGFTNYVGDLITCFTFNDKKRGMAPLANESHFDMAKPAPGYTYRRLDDYAASYGQYLADSSMLEMPSPVVHMMLIRKLQAMPIDEFCSLQSAFYLQAAEMGTTAKGLPLLKNTKPIAQTFAVKSFYEANPDMPERNSKVYRYAPWSFDIDSPTSTEQSIQRLTSARDWRGEDRKRYSWLTEMHDQGGMPSARHVAVATALSLVIPHLGKKQNISVHLSNDSYAKEFFRMIDKEEAKCLVRVVMPKGTAMKLLGATMMSRTVETRQQGDLYIDLLSMALPTIKKGTDMIQAVSEAYEGMKPTGDFIIRRKVLPEMKAAPAFPHVYYLGSAHTYDFFVSNIPKLSVAEAEYQLGSKQEAGDFIRTGRMLQSLNVQQMRIKQHADNRRKTEYFIAMPKPRANLALNLYDPPRDKTARQLKILAVTMKTYSGAQEFQDFDLYLDGEEDLDSVEDDAVPEDPGDDIQAQDFA